MKKEYIKPELQFNLYKTEDILSNDSSYDLGEDELPPVFGYSGRPFGN